MRRIREIMSGEKSIAAVKKNTGRFLAAAVLLAFFLCPVLTQAADSGENSGFRKKKISASSVDQTKKVKKLKTAGRKADSAFVRSAGTFSIRLLQETLQQSGKGGNLLVSPHSVLTALTLLENGTAGSTLSEMEQAFGGLSVKKMTRSLASMNRRLTGSEALTVRMANAVWFRRKAVSLKKKFLQNAVSYFDASIYSAPFDAQTVKDINAWVYNNTRGKIPSILNRLEPSSRAVLLNAVYFKGAWEKPFPDTVRKIFTGSDGKKKKVKMLSGSEDLCVRICGGEGFVKPYKGGEVSFMALLPPKGMNVEAYIRKLTGKDLTEGFRNRLKEREIVKTVMPPFTCEYSVSLKAILKEMGIREVFTERADLSGMSKSPLTADDVLHKTFIRLDKDGTEAAAVTAIIAKENAFIEPMPMRTICLNRPFVYALVDTATGIPLFTGVVRKV